MNKFLEIVYESQTENEFDKLYEKDFAPVLERLQQLLSEALYNEVTELLFACSVELSREHAVKGMELAIGIMDGTYIPIM